MLQFLIFLPHSVIHIFYFGHTVALKLNGRLQFVPHYKCRVTLDLWPFSSLCIKFNGRKHEDTPVHLIINLLFNGRLLHCYRDMLDKFICCFIFRGIGSILLLFF